MKEKEKHCFALSVPSAFDLHSDSSLCKPQMCRRELRSRYQDKAWVDAFSKSDMLEQVCEVFDGFLFVSCTVARIKDCCCVAS